MNAAILLSLCKQDELVLCTETVYYLLARLFFSFFISWICMIFSEFFLYFLHHDLRLHCAFLQILVCGHFLGLCFIHSAMKMTTDMTADDMKMRKNKKRDSFSI